MKKRDIFWLNRILIIFISSLIFVAISLYNIIQFNNSYIQEEKNELEIYKKNVEFIVSFLIKKDNIKHLKEYASIFEDDDEFSFRLFDKNKKLIVSSDEDLEHKKIRKNDKRMGKKKYDIWDLYIHSFHDKSLEKISKLHINNTNYYLEVSLSQEYVISSIIKAQKNILILFLIGMLCLTLSLIHIFYSTRAAFNSLEDSVIKISKGNLETEIKNPKCSLLDELSSAIISMTNRLKKQIEQLTMLEKYRKEFISNISHEIKTPITAINSAVELIESNVHTNGLENECFEIIKFQISAIDKLVGDILSLSEIDLEKTKNLKNFKIVNLNNAVKNAIDSVAIGFKIDFCCNNENIEVLGSEKFIITAISNLLTNAIKYSCSDKIEINLLKGENIIIEVKDYGIGISEEHLPRIFERFYRVDKDRSRSSGGNGLGLAIVKHIVELHNWKIEVYSEIGKGTTFRIII